MSQLTRAVRGVFGVARTKANLKRRVDPARSPAIALARFRSPYRLHFACGKVHLPDWVNIDQQVDPDIVDVSWDLRRPLPLAHGSAEFIFHEHFLEHLTVQEGLALLRECHRLLMPGGVLRVAMPDLT